MKQTIDVWEDQVHTLVGLLKYYPALNPLYKIKYNWVTIKIFSYRNLKMELWIYICKFFKVCFFFLQRVEGGGKMMQGTDGGE
jgi:hypothetical protein